MKPRVLIVDDSLTVRMDLSEAFEAAGFAPVRCSDLASARQALGAGSFSLIVLDVLLPDGDGVEFLKELKNDSRIASAPIMLLSTEAEVRDRIRGLKTGADEYVGKPYDPAYVIARANELVRSAHTAGENADPRVTVLIVDDSATFREALKQQLEQSGYRVLAAASGEDSLHVAINHRPAAIIVDNRLPGIDGRTVIRRIRDDAILRRTPCLLLTGSEDRLEELGALEAGADAFVHKDDGFPVILTRLAAVLRLATTPPALDSRKSVLGPKKILAVDDSDTYLQHLATQLRQEGYDVVVARSGQEAIDLLGVQSVDCILLDLIMPGLSGHETCRRIKGNPGLRDIPLLVLTGLEEHAALLEGINAGADDYILKSNGFEVLRARMRAALRRKQFEDENRDVREQLLRKKLEAADARAQHELAELRAALLADLATKNEELRRARDAAERDSRFKSSFLAAMSHEVRTPLNSILALARLLLTSETMKLAGEQEKQVRFIRQSAEELANLVNDLLDLAKIEAGKMAVRAFDFKVSDLFAGLKDFARPLLPADGAIQLVFEDPQDLRMVSDFSKLAQILRNLAANALKFTPSGEVRISARPGEEDKVVLTVSDTGIGIAPENHAKIFDEFTQLDTALQKRSKGTGLGLPLSRRLAEILGGTIKVESQPGVGSTFQVVLPRTYTGGKEALLEPAAANAATGAAAPVLIIDDDEIARYLLKRAASDAGLSLVEACGGIEGIAKARELRPRAIFLDLVMPGADGFTVLEQLKDDPVTAEIPVIIWTSKPLTVEDRVRLTKATLVVSKGSTPPEQVHSLLRELVKAKTAAGSA